MNFLKKNLLFAVIIIFVICNSSFSLNINVSLATKSEYSYQDSDEFEESQIAEKIFGDVKIGDEVRFGRFYDYVDDENIEKTPIAWKVLDQIKDFSLLISKDILKTMPYNYSWSPTNWKDSSVRLWLNYDFYDIAFNEEEKRLIKRITTANIGNAVYSVKDIFQTKDYIFLLSIEEAKKYHSSDKDFMVKGTKYAIREGLWISRYISSNGYSVWWLRSPGKSLSSAAIIHAAGSIGIGGDGVATRGNGVRPCMWVKTK